MRVRHIKDLTEDERAVLSNMIAKYENYLIIAHSISSPHFKILNDLKEKLNILLRD